MPRDQRYCVYCVTAPTGPQAGVQGINKPIDDELHALTECCVVNSERLLLYNDLASRNANFSQLSETDKFKVMVCPISAVDCKRVSRFIGQLFCVRDRIDIQGRAGK